MNSIQDFLGLATTMVVLGLIVAGVMRLFQISTDIQESKEILKDIRRNMQGFGAPAPGSSAGAGLAGMGLPGTGLSGIVPGRTPPTPEELVRAVHAQDFRGDEFPL